jgi:hypothetical protein
MSRPPRPHVSTSTTGDQNGRRTWFDYFPMELEDLVDLQREIAAEAGLGADQGDGDFARTLMEASGVLAHLLGLYQDHYALEAFLGTARSDRSLVRHARRLAYEPDRGMSATGLVVLTIGEGLEGTLRRGFGLASVPTGRTSAQDYETTADLEVKGDWNAMTPVDATLPTVIDFDASGRATLRVEGRRHPLEIGDPMLLAGPGALRLALWLEDLEERAGATHLTVRTDPATAPGSPIPLPAFDPDDETTHCRILAKPRLQAHPFAWNADPALYPPNAVRFAGTYTTPTVPSPLPSPLPAPVLGYQPALAPNDLPLSAEAPGPRGEPWVLHRDGDTLVPYRVASTRLATVAIRRGEIVAIPTPTFHSDGTPVIDSSTGLVVMTEIGQVQETGLSGAVTVWTLLTASGNPVSRSSLAFPSTFLGDLSLELRVPDRTPNPAPVTQPLEIAGDLGRLRPGRFLVVSTRDRTARQIATVKKIDRDTVNGRSDLYWDVVSGSGVFTLADVVVHGNVAEVAHGKRKTEILGGSDGVTPFQRFTLKQPRLSLRPGADGAEPALEVRVNDVAWQRVDDFFFSRPEDRHYRIEIDSEQQTTIVFGDGAKAAIPPSGRKHITATYSVGLGNEGNAAAGGLSRIKKADPLVDDAVNLSGVTGGAEPARSEDLRRQATRHLRTFDRAVSVQDHADLVLLYPGIARASAAWNDATGISLVAADAQGLPPADRAALRSYLDRRRDTGIPLDIVDPEPVDIYLTVSVEHLGSHLFEVVKLSIQEALLGDDEDRPGLFTFAARTFGQGAHLSEVYQRVDAVDGVASVSIERFALSASGGAMDLVRASAAQWLRLLPGNCSVLSLGEVSP